MKKPMNTQPKVVSQLVDLCLLIRSIADSVQANQRQIVAIAGPPGSGKSTLLADLVPLLQAELGSDEVVGLPMDGFHLDNVQLDRDGTRAVKGAPHTFDVFGLLALVQRLHKGESPVYAPEFDRASDLSRNCAIKIGPTHKMVLIEGNYLLLDLPGWRELAKYYALMISIDVPATILHERLVQRWLHYGLSEQEASEKAQSNDIPNAHTVLEQSICADLIYRPENKQ